MVKGLFINLIIPLDVYLAIYANFLITKLQSLQWLVCYLEITSKDIWNSEQFIDINTNKSGFCLIFCYTEWYEIKFVNMYTIHTSID